VENEKGERKKEEEYEVRKEREIEEAKNLRDLRNLLSNQRNDTRAPGISLPPRARNSFKNLSLFRK
jgi:hypothetical protein